MTTCNSDYIIDFHISLKSRPSERKAFKKSEKIYPLPCQNYACFEKPTLKRYYKAICKMCLSTTSTTDKKRNTICITCENKIKNHSLNSIKMKAICYCCNQTVFSFQKNKYGFICSTCHILEEYKEQKENKNFCSICEYEVEINKNKICNSCLNGEIRKQILDQGRKVLCCNCEQVAIQFNPQNHNNVYCQECKVSMLNNDII